MGRIDLRSDTVTRPTPEMRAAMAQAPVGDDVFDEDPTVHELQEKVAEMLGFQAAMFVPSGTMANQIAIRCHTSPGDELLCDETCHIYVWEAGGPATLSGITCRPIAAPNGLLRDVHLEGKIRPNNEHYARTRLVTLENTHNRGGGKVYPLEWIDGIYQWADQHGLAMHLDGARIWNAHIASSLSLKELCRNFDTASVCFSKGLGAPVGSALLGSKSFIAEARRTRKLFGGGMRQVGILAAGALHALHHHIERLQDDHANAKTLAHAIENASGLKLEQGPPETNLVWFEIDPTLGNAAQLVSTLQHFNIELMAVGPHTLRAVTHLDVSSTDASFVAEKLALAGSGKIPLTPVASHIEVG
ncbi:MAG: low-specificity L-threonine aldolase [Zavarzinella sp.]